MNRARVFLNALGIVSAIGHDKQTNLRALLAATPRPLTLDSNSIRDFPVPVGQINMNLPSVPAHLWHYDCRNNALLMAAYQQIADNVERACTQYGRQRIGIVIGTSTSGIAAGETALACHIKHDQYPSNYHYRQQEIGTAAEFLAAWLDIRGPAYTISTACSSGGKAMISARRLIHSGVCDAVIVGGSDSLCRLTLNGFHALESVSAKTCNPFSMHRNGINIGEGAALFLMTPQHAGIEILGMGESSDAHHMSAPDPTGAGAELAIRGALNDAQLKPDAIHYINLHGTATPKNDAMEGLVVNRVFGPDTPCSSTKPLTGHTLGAAGAIEAAFCCLTLSADNTDSLLPPQHWDKITDPAIPPIRLVQAGTQFERQQRNIMMSNSFAFGGSNVSLIFGTIE